MQLPHVLDLPLKRWKARSLTFEDLCEDVPDQDLPPLDRRDVALDSLDDEQRAWREDGFVIRRGFIPEDRIDAYCDIRARDGAWPGPCAYLHVPQIRDLCLYPPLMDLLQKLIGSPMAMHLNLTGWKSTERDWHQDDYLNPATVNAHYLAVWFALEDIHPDCGVFQYVPGTHRWPSVRGHIVRQHLPHREANSTMWPTYSENILTPIVERQLAETGAEPQVFLPKKGDVLVWHGKLIHRGSRPIDDSLERRAIITHYSAVDKRPDMPNVQRHEEGGLFMVPESFQELYDGGGTEVTQ